MERGAIPIEELPGGLDLQSTLESGQTYHWRRRDGAMYESTGSYGGDAWYYTVVDGEVIHARQHDGRLEWTATTDAVPYLEDLLRLKDDLDAIIKATPSDSLIERAYRTYRGMRIVKDPFFPCLISFICSAQMRVERIFEMQTALRQEYGRETSADGTTYNDFPTPERLAEATESELRDLGLGYRAPYVRKTADLVAEGAQSPDTLPTDYEQARDAMQVYVGVGEKVADCVLLFSQGYLEAIPLDTWIRTAIEEYYPHCDHGSYKETSRALRAEFGPYSGYTQTYVFHYLRHHH
ncbi:MAG: DNA-3-methyladenine glycosylase [Halobacteriales archaeon]